MKRHFFLSLLFLAVTFSFSSAQQYSSKLKALLIDLPGWHAGDPEGMDANFNNVFIITASREYTKGDASLSASVLAGQAAASYEMQKMSYETDEGFLKTRKISGYDAYISYDEQDNSGAIIVLLTQKPHAAVFVLTYENMGWQQAETLAQKFNWDKMKNIVEEIK